MATTKQQDRMIAKELEERFTLVDDETFQNKDYSWILDWVRSHCEPEDVFYRSDLSRWAENNGFVEEE